MLSIVCSLLRIFTGWSNTFPNLKHLKLPPWFGSMEGNITEDCKLWASLSHGPSSFVQTWLGAGSFGSVEWWRECGCMWINETGAWDFHPLEITHASACASQIHLQIPTGRKSSELVLILWLLAYQSSPAKPIPVEHNQCFNKAWGLVAAFDLVIVNIAYRSSWSKISINDAIDQYSKLLTLDIFDHGWPRPVLRPLRFV